MRVLCGWLLLLSGVGMVAHAAPLDPRAAYAPLASGTSVDAVASAPRVRPTRPTEDLPASRIPTTPLPEDMPNHLKALMGQSSEWKQIEQQHPELLEALHKALPAPQEVADLPPLPETPPPRAPRSKDPTGDAAFNETLKKMLPMSPEQIRQFNKFYEMTQRAAAEPPTAPPTPVSSSLLVDLKPGNTPPVVRLASGFVSSLILLDATGAPWPIVAYSLGDPERFNIQWDQNSHALFVQGLHPYAHANLAIRLQDLDTPVMLSLVTGQREVDYRVDVQVKGRGPQAHSPVIQNKNELASGDLMSILDGIAPARSRKLELNPAFGEAWLVNKQLYLRTPHTLISPAWQNTVASADGTRVYTLSPASFVLLSHEGKTHTVRIGGLS